MKYSFVLSEQIGYALLCVGLGVLLAICYRCISAFIRSLFSGRASIVCSDLLFCALAAVISYSFFLLYDYGRIRLFSFVAAGVGYAAYMLTLDRLVSPVLGLIFSALGRLLRLVFNPLVVLFTAVRRLFARLLRLLYDAAVAIRHKTKKSGEGTATGTAKIRRRKIKRTENFKKF